MRLHRYGLWHLRVICTFEYTSVVLWRIARVRRSLNLYPLLPLPLTISFLSHPLHSIPLCTPPIINLPLQELTTPLHWATCNGHLESVRLLLDRGADKEAKDMVRG